MSKLNNLEPQKVFYYFEEISNIPHGSGNTKEISDYLVKFANDRGLFVSRDSLNNIIIKKDATPGYENAVPIIIQGHTDMVCEKENDCNIDFEKDPLDLYVDGDYLRARGTTLGGDDGIAVAYALAILDSDDIAHPKLEVVLTVDEEVGMLGAFDMDLSSLEGKKMLNIDSDLEGHFLTSCAGGMCVIADIPVKRVSQSGTKLELKVTGLQGGHSGGEIHQERGNASILMGRLLNLLLKNVPYGIETLQGGLKDNAIPRECVSTILVPTEAKEAVCQIVAEFDSVMKQEFAISDSQVSVLVKDLGEDTLEILDYASVNRIVFYLHTIPNGVQHMSKIMDGLVETSLNLGIMELKKDALHTTTSIRSSVSSRKEDLCDKCIQIIEMVGGEATVEGAYPAWEYKNNSPLRDEIAKAYHNLYGKEPIFEAIHAGLECGIFSEKIEGLDCVSFGPNNLDIHTPMERLSISSTKRVWEFLIEFLKNAR
ncbi:MAG: aminoacyl-histidine dipeptidase [Agathobacter sp.]|nr:aminoacyl-histidine dipeptidase [Agathobacter sp.]